MELGDGLGVLGMAKVVGGEGTERGWSRWMWLSQSLERNKLSIGSGGGGRKKSGGEGWCRVVITLTGGVGLEAV